MVPHPFGSTSTHVPGPAPAGRAPRGARGKGRASESRSAERRASGFARPDAGPDAGASAPRTRPAAESRAPLVDPTWIPMLEDIAGELAF